MYMLAAGAQGQTQQEIFDKITKTVGIGYKRFLSDFVTIFSQK